MLESHPGPCILHSFQQSACDRRHFIRGLFFFEFVVKSVRTTRWECREFFVTLLLISTQVQVLLGVF
jgi:hypothetical protein